MLLFFMTISTQNGMKFSIHFQVPLVASNRVGKEIIETEHGKSEITFYGNSFITGIRLVVFLVFTEHKRHRYHDISGFLTLLIDFGLFCYHEQDPLEKLLQKLTIKKKLFL